jgi:hypothetical protein
MPTQRTKDVSLESCRGKMARTQLPSSCSCVKGAQLRHGCNRVSRNTFATGGIYTPPQFPSAFSRSPGPASRPQTCCPFRTHTQELVLQKNTKPARFLPDTSRRQPYVRNDSVVGACRATTPHGRALSALSMLHERTRRLSRSLELGLQKMNGMTSAHAY